MSSSSFHATQRRIAFKRRAKLISGHFYLPILFAAILYAWPMQLISSLLSGIEYTGPVLVIENLQVSIPLVREMLLLLVSFLEAPLVLGLYSYLISLDREQPVSCFSVFSWFAEGSKLYSAGKYALFECVISLILFPLNRLPLMVLSANMENYAKTAAEAVSSIQKGASPENAMLEMAAGNNQRILLFALVLLGLLLKSVVAAVPFVCAMDTEGEKGFFSKLKLSLSCMKGHFIEYIVLQISFVGWYFLASMMGDYLSIIVYPYLLTTQAIFFNRLVMSSTCPPSGKPEDPGPEEENQEQSEER